MTAIIYVIIGGLVGWVAHIVLRLSDPVATAQMVGTAMFAALLAGEVFAAGSFNAGFAATGLSVGSITIALLSAIGAIPIIRLGSGRRGFGRQRRCSLTLPEPLGPLANHLFIGDAKSRRPSRHA